jgi:hypothetical protein
MIYKYGEPRWSDNERGNLKNSERKLSHFNFVHHKSHMNRSGREPWLPWLEVDG